MPPSSSVRGRSSPQSRSARRTLAGMDRTELVAGARRRRRRRPRSRSGSRSGCPGSRATRRPARRSVLDKRFGRRRVADRPRRPGAHRDRRPSPSSSTRRRTAQFLRDRPALVRFLVTTCGNVYDDNPSNVFDDAYEQPHTALNHYQDISVRRVVAELVDDPDWPEVVDDAARDRRPRRPRDRARPAACRGHAGSAATHLLQIRDPLSPGYVLNPAVVPGPRPGADHDASRTATSGTTSRAAATSRSRRSGR